MAESLSRKPNDEESRDEKDSAMYMVHWSSKIITYEQVIQHTQPDVELQEIKTWYREGWPKFCLPHPSLPHCNFL